MDSWVWLLSSFVKITLFAFCRILMKLGFWTELLNISSVLVLWHKFSAHPFLRVLNIRNVMLHVLGGDYLLISHVVLVDFAQNWADLLCSQMASVAVYCLLSWSWWGGARRGGTGLLSEIPSCNPASLQWRAEWAVEVTAGSTHTPALCGTVQSAFWFQPLVSASDTVCREAFLWEKLGVAILILKEPEEVCLTSFFFSEEENLMAEPVASKCWVPSSVWQHVTCYLMSCYMLEWVGICGKFPFLSFFIIFLLTQNLFLSAEIRFLGFFLKYLDLWDFPIGPEI